MLAQSTSLTLDLLCQEEITLSAVAELPAGSEGPLSETPAPLLTMLGDGDDDGLCWVFPFSSYPWVQCGKENEQQPVVNSSMPNE